ncbi:cleavage and polyadenylation specificity factor subunit 4 [Lepeophtheirus salmonis]|uniref:Cleavage and polyadenylation specificity factor subunit 4 n=2 Tax=Lepeophtheirus salmonis TaxID=72036 RepID=A0A0K2TKA6_LEPSM|nr:cleavage and polyadenylation specificity factor subunit 4-like [Lepeophtheirus salmonis]
MDLLVAPVDHIRFKMENDLENQVGSCPLPFPGMDKSGSAVCEFYVKATCSKGTCCPFRHVRGDKTIVCKHWLRGLCKKGDTCEFLHEYDMSKMPECYFYSRFNACHNKECPFLHIDPESKIRDCPWYDRGFCRHGPSCRHRHVRRILCMNYLAGFCPVGPSCSDAHPRFELPAPQETDPRLGKKIVITCHYCGEAGHKVSHCAKMPQELRDQHALAGGGNDMYMNKSNYGFANNRSEELPANNTKKYKNLDEIICYKCGEVGHFANKCSKGHLAFLSSNNSQIQQRIKEQQQR